MYDAAAPRARRRTRRVRCVFFIPSLLLFLIIIILFFFFVNTTGFQELGDRPAAIMLNKLCEQRVHGILNKLYFRL